MLNSITHMPMTDTRELSVRDKFIIKKGKDFTPSEIVILLARNGFAPISRTRVYQVLWDAGVDPVSMRKKK